MEVDGAYVCDYTLGSCISVHLHNKILDYANTESITAQITRLCLGKSFVEYINWEEKERMSVEATELHSSVIS